MSDEYVSFAAARKILQAAMNQAAGKMVSEQVTAHINRLRERQGQPLTDTAVMVGIETLVTKPSKEYLELARAIAVLYDAELRANSHMMPPNRS